MEGLTRKRQSVGLTSLSLSSLIRKVEMYDADRYLPLGMAAGVERKHFGKRRCPGSDATGERSDFWRSSWARGLEGSLTLTSGSGCRIDRSGQ